MGGDGQDAARRIALASPRAARRGKAPAVPTAPAAPLPVGGATSSLRVHVIAGVDTGRSAPLGDEARPTTIGARRGLDLTLHDPDVADEHVAIWACPEGIGVRALDPRRAIFVGALRLRDAVIPTGTCIELGSTVITAEPRPAAGDLAALFDREGLAFEGAAMREVAEAIVRLAPHTTSVLVEGETGTGNEVVARAIHRLGLRANGPFVVVDCGALPPSLLESELFGHERGAFTGAERRSLGAFERAHGGTLLLDEIGELPLAHQPALLGVLQRHRFRRVGGDREVEVDVRVIAATNRDLRARIAEGAFRADLYYRLACAYVSVPPLRERLSDLPALVAHLAEEITGSRYGIALDEREIAALAGHSFPGNVRELRAILERVHTLGRFDLGVGPARPRAAEPSAPISTYRDARAHTLQQFERDFLRRLINACEGNASEAARVARMDRPFLLKLLHRHGLR